MIKLLYKLFPRQFNRLVFEEQQSRKDWRDLCEVGFVDADGRKYYQYKQDYKMPLNRAVYVDNLKTQYLLTWSEAEQQAYDKKLNGLFEQIEQGKQINQYYKQLAELKSLLEEKDKRKGHIIQADILIEMVACLLIREDEDPNDVNELILSQKVETFKKKIEFQFLKQRNIIELIGLSQITEEQFKQLWAYSTKIQQAKSKILNSTTKG